MLEIRDLHVKFHNSNREAVGGVSYTIEDGEIHILGKARGSRQGNNLLAQEIEKCGGVDFTKPVLLGYTGMSDVLLQKYKEDSKHLWQDGVDNLRSTCIGSVIGTHAGPGAVAVAFFTK